MCCVKFNVTMHQQLFILLFLTGIIPLLSLPRKYYLIKQSSSWINAQAYCRAKYIDLATIESTSEVAKLQSEAQNQQFSSSAWVGLYKHYHGWRWSFGNEVLGPLNIWKLGQPDNFMGVEECGCTSFLDWMDVPCGAQQPFICFDERKTGNDRYTYYAFQRSWHDAQSYCRQHHTDLASMRSLEEILAVQTKALNNSWIGLCMYSWNWSDQTDTPTIMWAPGHPSTAGLIPFCGYFKNDQALDTQCSDLKPFFCYSVITGQKQIIRIKVQSDQDMHDPELMALILKQIQQTLEDLSLGNITANWRQQSHVRVFRQIN